MGPNGAGKSTLASVIMGHPGYRVTSGEILLHGENIAAWTPDQRARAGIFLAFQVPRSDQWRFRHPVSSSSHRRA